MADHCLPIRGVTSDGEVVGIQEAPLGHLSQLAGWENFVTSAEDLLRSLGLGLTQDYGNPWRGNAAVVWRIAPDRVLIRSDRPLELASTSELVALDLSQARVRLRLTGRGAANLLARLAPLDFSDTAFPIGSFAQTGMHHIGVLVDRLDVDEFEIFIPTTWASSLVGLIGEHLH